MWFVYWIQNVLFHFSNISCACYVSFLSLSLSLFFFFITLLHRTNVVMNYSEVESKVREATNDDPWGPSGQLMSEISRLAQQSTMLRVCFLCLLFCRSILLWNSIAVNWVLFWFIVAWCFSHLRYIDSRQEAHHRCVTLAFAMSLVFATHFGKWKLSIAVKSFNSGWGSLSGLYGTYGFGQCEILKKNQSFIS